MNYYQKHAQQYIEDTFYLNMSDSYKLFLKHIKRGGVILDVGCGSGRDSLYFQKEGYKVYAIDPVKKFCDHAKKIGIKNVRCLKIEDINYKNKFDGIWASASLLHLKNQNLISALNKCYTALARKGVMFASFKLGTYSGVRDNRYYNDMNKIKFSSIISKTNFQLSTYLIEKDKLNRTNLWFSIILTK